MVNRLYIMPYEPGLWSPENLLKYGEPKSSLAIVFRDFVNEAAKAWDIQSQGSTVFSLIVNEKVSIYCYFIEHQIICCEIAEGGKISEFILWYRSYVSDEYDLFLFVEGSDEALRLTRNTVLQDIVDFLWG